MTSASPARRADDHLGSGYATQLRRRIGWICQTVRYAALAYAGWVLFMVVRFWADGELVRRIFQHRLNGIDLGEVAAWQRFAGLCISMADWALVVAAVYAVWRMMGEYLAGRIFSSDAAIWLGRIGLFGLAALAFDIAARPLTSLVVTAHLPAGGKYFSIFFQPNDLLNAMFLLAFVALAHIFKSASALADDHAQIV